MSIFGQNSAFLASLTIYIELEGHMIPQNDTLHEAGNLQCQSIFRLTWANLINLSLPKNDHFWTKFSIFGEGDHIH